MLYVDTKLLTLKVQKVSLFFSLQLSILNRKQRRETANVVADTSPVCGKQHCIPKP